MKRGEEEEEEEGEGGVEGGEEEKRPDWFISDRRSSISSENRVGTLVRTSFASTNWRRREDEGVG